MQIIDREIVHAPRDFETRFWRARLLLWSGRIRDAEQEYLALVLASPNDADYWIGLASVYAREGRVQEELETLDRALALDAERADIHLARGRALETAHSPDAQLEFQKALDLDPASEEARNALRSMRGEPKHELRFGTNTYLFSFIPANYEEEVTLTSQWTRGWRTTATGAFYRWGGIDAEKVTASVTRQLPRWGSLEVGGATANANSVIPKNEAFFIYDNGWKFHRNWWIGGLETVCGQHWYSYSTAEIVTLNETSIFYLPEDWTWSLGVIEARSNFFGTGTEWRPSGTTKLGFPIAGHEDQRLEGNLVFAAGTESFAELDQIGRFSSQTYGGGLRLQLTTHQNVSGMGAYQKRTQNRSETTFGFSYGIRF